MSKEVDLAVELGISRKTLRRALDQMARERLIDRVKGKGTFVARDGGQRRKILIVLNENQDISNPYPYLMPGILFAAAAADIEVENCMPQSLLSLPPELAAAKIRADRPIGILMLGNNFTGREPVLEPLRQTGVPVVLPHCAAGDRDSSGFAAMHVDYEQVVLDGLRYLKAQGHRRIGTVYKSDDGHGISRERYRALQQQAGVDLDPACFCRTAYHYATIKAGVEQLLLLPRPPTALFCYSDFFALHVYRCLKQRGIRIPEDMSVLSIGGHIGCNYLIPTLSAIDFDLPRIGRAAVELLLELAGHPPPPGEAMPEVISPHHIVERESTGFPRVSSLTTRETVLL